MEEAFARGSSGRFGAGEVGGPENLSHGLEVFLAEDLGGFEKLCVYKSKAAKA